jgi:hypothetical protein
MGWGPPNFFPINTPRANLGPIGSALTCRERAWFGGRYRRYNGLRGIESSMLGQKFKLVGLIVACLFFLWFGIDLLISSYRLNNPFTFVMTFFASNLMILISVSLALGFALRLKRQFRSAKESEDPPANPPS